MNQLYPSLILALAAIAILSLLSVVGHREDKGLSFAQRIIRSWFRLSRWSYAKAQGYNAFLVHYRRGRQAQQQAYAQAMLMPLPELATAAELNENAAA